MAVVGLMAPWMEYYQKVNAFFANDPEVHVIYDDSIKALTLYVEDAGKATALDTLMVSKKVFGDIDVTIHVVPANDITIDLADSDLGTLFDVAFNGNDALVFTHTVDGFADFIATYVVFKKEVIQYYTDDLGDYYGVKSTLYEDIARDIFGPINGVFYSTNVEC